jgi:hypothetical protein
MKKFTSVDYLFEDIEKNYTPWDKFILNPKNQCLRWLIYNAKDVPFDFYRKCKRGWQRAYWGISEEDTWSVDYYLSEIILRGLRKLQDDKQGCPILDGYNPESDEEFYLMDKEWKRILGTMIYTFEVTQRVQNDNWILQPDKGFTDEEMKRLEKNFHVMSAKEMSKYWENWSNFQKYYFSLWS